MKTQWKYALYSWRHRLPPISRLRYRAVAVVAFWLLPLIGLLVAVQIIPEWQVSRANVNAIVAEQTAGPTLAEVAALQNEMRKTFLQAVGGAFLLFALY